MTTTRKAPAAAATTPTPTASSKPRATRATKTAGVVVADSAAPITKPKTPARKKSVSASDKLAAMLPTDSSVKTQITPKAAWPFPTGPKP